MLAFPVGVVIGVMVGVLSVTIGARLVATLGTSQPLTWDQVTRPTSGRLQSLPVIMRDESQDAELAKQMNGYIPPVFDNLEGLGAAYDNTTR